MTASVDLVTTAEVNTYLGLSTSSATDTLIAELIDIVSEDVETFCNTTLSSDTTVENLDGGKLFLITKKAPVISITVISDNDDSDTVFDSTFYEFYPGSGRIYKVVDGDVYPLSQSLWSAGRQRWKVTYQAGHAAVPEAVKWVTYQVIGRHLNNLPSSNTKGRWTQQNIIETKSPMMTEFTQQEKRILAKYRMMTL